MKKVRDLQAPPLQLLLGMNTWHQQLTSTGPGFRERPFRPTAWAGQWMASPRRVGSRRVVPAMPWGLGAEPYVDSVRLMDVSSPLGNLAMRVAKSVNPFGGATVRWV
jgi:hypothetical protein